ncbi:hypothetical protein FQA39_LY08237 [Lamprigera yunnana]|nr:hypothetical protein FQA39_LY08237 [Lamprigera yunnana]
MNFKTSYNFNSELTYRYSQLNIVCPPTLERKDFHKKVQLHSRPHRKKDLPHDFSIVKPCFMAGKQLKIPPREQSSIVVSDTSPHQREKEWLEMCRSSESLPWSVFYALKMIKDNLSTGTSQKSATRTAVLPLFAEQAHSMAMMKHSMQVVSSATEYLNPG